MYDTIDNCKFHLFHFCFVLFCLLFPKINDDNCNQQNNQRKPETDRPDTLWIDSNVVIYRLYHFLCFTFFSLACFGECCCLNQPDF